MQGHHVHNCGCKYCQQALRYACLLYILLFSKCSFLQQDVHADIQIHLACLCFFVISGYGDMTFNLVAYSCGLASNFTQAVYLLLVQRFTQHHKLTTVETLQLNCFNSLPILVLAAVFNGELASLRGYPIAEHPIFPLAFFLTVSVGMLLNYSLFLCTGLTSALTTSVVGGLKAMVQTLLGLVTFGGVSHNIPTYLGIVLNLMGGTGYIAVKYRENDKKLHKSIHKVMSFSSLSGKGISQDHGGKVSNGFVTSASNDAPEGIVVKERSHGDHSVSWDTSRQ